MDQNLRSVFGGDSDTELRNIALKEGPNEAAAPPERGRVVGCQERPRKAAPAPQTILALGSNLAEIEAAQVDEPHPPREGLGGAFEQGRRGTAENQKSGLRLVPIDQYAQDFEQLRLALHLVDDDESIQRGEGAHRRRELADIERGFQVEEFAGRLIGAQHMRQGGLSALSRPENGDARMAAEELSNTDDAMGPIDHAQRIFLENPNMNV
jgi:hypothetical protein